MLFFKECKKTVCSLTFILYVLTVVVMYVSQFSSSLENAEAKPVQGAEYYGMKETEEPEIVMPAAVEGLVSEYLAGYYVAYPFGFYKEVKLKEADNVAMAAIIEELTGLTKQELDGFTEYMPGGYVEAYDENTTPVAVYRMPVLPEYELSEKVSYERFLELMAEADELIGGGSKYRERNLSNQFGQIPMTYEDAVEEYEELMREDNLVEGYTRLYCDYLGIVLSVMPIFVCVGLWQMDKRANMEQLVYSRRVSSVKLVGTRYLAMVSCMAVPVILTFLVTLVGLYRLYPEKELAFGHAAGLAGLWLLPAILAVSALGTLISELISPLLAIFVQGIWWYMSLEMTELVGDITRWGLIVRHNTLGRTGVFQAQWTDFIWNRLWYIGLTLIFISITMLVYERKRKGMRR